MCDSEAAISTHDERLADVCHGRCKRLQVLGAEPLHPPGHSSPKLFAHHKGARQGCEDC